MHTTDLLKGVLKPRTLNSTSANQESGAASTLDNAAAAARGKRAFSSDNALPSASLNPKKSSLPVKMACLCAPTKHAGSFRCRLHRVTKQHWGGRPLELSSTSNASSSSSLPATENSAAVGSIPRSKALPAPPPGSMSRTGAGRPSRLRMVVVAAQSEEVVTSVADDSSASPVLSEGSVKYIKVASTNVVTSNVGALEAGATALRIMKSST